MLKEMEEKERAEGVMPTDGSYDAENADFEAVTITNEQNMRVSEDPDNENAVLDNKKSASGNEAESRYSVKHAKNGSRYWEIDSGKDIFKGLKSPEEYREAAYRYLISNRDNKVVVKDASGNEIIFIRLSAEEFTHNKESKELLKKDPKLFEQKMRLVPSLEDILLHADTQWNSPDHKNHKLFKKRGFGNYRGRVGIDEVVFNYIVRIGKTDFGDVFYDINLEVDSYLPHVKNDASDINEPTSNNSIPDSSEKVNSETKFSLKKPQIDALKKRGVNGDRLLDAIDLADEILSVNGEITEDSKVVLYHATSEENANKINATGKMYGKEDNLFFSTRSDGEIVGYGKAVVRAEIPLEKLTLNDVFDQEVHLTMSVKPYQLTNIRFSYKRPAEGKVHKQIAEWEKLRVYEKVDAEKILYTVLSDVMALSESEKKLLLEYSGY